MSGVLAGLFLADASPPSNRSLEKVRRFDPVRKGWQ